MKNKDLARKTQLILATFGYDVKLSHAYELLSQLSGFKNWNTAQALGVDFNSQFAQANSPEEFLRERLRAAEQEVDEISLLLRNRMEVQSASHE